MTSWIVRLWSPARLTAVCIPLAAALLGLDPGGAWRLWRRDAAKHASPNAGHYEAAMAGALGVRLGGTNVYDGQRHEGPTFGEPTNALRPDHIAQANRLALATEAVFLLLSVAILIAVDWATR